MKNGSPVYLCLYVDHIHVQTRLRFHPEALHTPVAIVDGEAGLKMLIDMNKAAASRGMSIGMSSVQAGLDPELLMFPHSAEEEAATKDQLIQACSRITPLIEDCSLDNACVLVLEIGASLKLFGDVAQLASQLLSSLDAFKLEARVAVSCNFHTCRLLAKSRLHAPFVTVPVGEERLALAGLQVSSLPLSYEQQETFTNWGIHRIGDLAALPLAELISRMGQTAKALYELAHGMHPHVFVPIVLAAPLKESVAFDSAVDLYESLLFSLAPMLEKLIARAQEEMKSISALTLALGLSNHSTHIRTIQPAIPSTSSRLLLKLIHLDMEAHPPVADVLDMSLTATLDTRPKAQLGIFSPQHPDASQLHVTLARIRKLVGAAHVGAPVLEDGHRQSLFKLNDFTVHGASQPDAPARSGVVAMRQLRESIPIPVTLHNKVPAAFLFDGHTYRVDRAYGPWMSSGQWWNEAAWNMSQWDVIASTQAQRPIYCCLTLDRMSGTWALDGMYD